MARLLLIVIAALGLAQPSIARAQQPASSSGTGFFVNEEGWLATNFHVIDGCREVEVVGYGIADRQVYDRNSDLAAIHVAPSRRTVPLPIQPGEARLGQQVIALGFPLADILSSSVKMTMGNVSSLAGPQDSGGILQISVPLQPGNSGGPLLNMAGQLVGINTAILKNEFNAQNVNFAVKARLLRDLLRRNAIAFTEAPAAAADSLAVEDVAQIGERSTVQIFCHGATGGDQSVEAEPDAPPVERLYLGLFGHLDLWGGDIHEKGIEAADPGTCAVQCGQHPACRAFTYNEKYRRCFLKHSAEIPVISEGIVSGLIFSAPDEETASDKSVAAEFIMYPSARYTFVKLPFFQPGSRKGTIDSCLRHCRGDSACKYLTFDPGQKGRDICSVWNTIPGSRERARQATSFEKISRSVRAHAVVPIGEDQAQ